jgi:hypothetical protein
VWAEGGVISVLLVQGTYLRLDHGGTRPQDVTTGPDRHPDRFLGS